MNKDFVLNVVNKVDKFWESSDDVLSFTTKLVKDKKFAGIFAKFKGSSLFVISFLVQAKKNNQDLDKIFDEIKDNLFVFTTILVRNTEPMVECSACDGDGTFDCPSCDGDGREQCWECGGSGEKECEDCEGTGEDSDGEECTRCYGSGKQSCGECLGDGETSCEQCGGRGEKTCYTCEGDGEVRTHEQYFVIQKQYISYDREYLNYLEDLTIESELDHSPVIDITSLLREERGYVESWEYNSFREGGEYFMGLFKNEDGNVGVTILNSHNEFMFDSYNLDNFLN
jgi:hypothetical protein